MSLSVSKLVRDYEASKGLPEIGDMKHDERLAELRAGGVERNSFGAIDKQGNGKYTVPRGMLAKLRMDQAARAAGYGPCATHPDQVDFVCPYCRRIWR